MVRVGCWGLFNYITGGCWLTTTNLTWTVLGSKTNNTPYSSSSACGYRQKGKGMKPGSVPKIAGRSAIESTGNKSTLNLCVCVCVRKTNRM